MMSRNYTPERTLIDKFLLSDAEAFEELTRRYCYSLYVYCLEKLNSPDDARRVVRTVFINLWEKRHSLSFDFSLNLFLYSEVRKTVVQFLNGKLNNGTEPLLEESIIRGFSADKLKEAKKPVKNAFRKNSTIRSSVITKGKYDEPWQEKPSPMISLKGLRSAIRQMLNLF